MKKRRSRTHNPPRLGGLLLGFGASWLLADIAKLPFAHPVAKVAASASVDVGLLLGSESLQKALQYDKSINTGIKWGATLGLLFSVAKIVREDDLAVNGVNDIDLVQDSKHEENVGMTAFAAPQTNTLLL